jgi:hypothetical protein
MKIQIAAARHCRSFWFGAHGIRPSDHFETKKPLEGSSGFEFLERILI